MASPSSRRWFALASLALLAVPAGRAAPVAFGAQAAQPQRTDTARRAAERIRALQREAEALVAQESAILAQLRKLEIDRRLKTEELSRIQQERTEAEATLQASRARMETLRQAAETERPEIEGRLVRVYKLGQAGFWRLLLDVEDLRSMSRAYRTAAALTKINRDRVLAHQRTLDQLASEQKLLQQRIAAIAQLEADARSAQAAIDRTVAARTALVASIDARRDLNAQLTGELQAAQQRLQASINQLGASAGPVMLPLKAFRGALPWPARGQLSARFGRQPSSRFGTAVIRNGIELAVPENQPVRAVHEGTVAYAEPFTGYGNLVIVEHGDKTYSLYGFLNEVDVSKGDHVEASGRIGTSGINPSGGPALYFELRVDGKPVDPLQWLARE